MRAFSFLPKFETRALAWGVLLAALVVSGTLRGVYTHQMIRSGLHDWNVAPNTDMWRFHHAASYILGYRNIDRRPADRDSLYAEPRPERGDIGWYDDRGGCIQSPVFNFVVAGVYGLTSPFLAARGQTLAVVALNHVLGLAAIVLVFLFARRVWSPGAAALATVLMALHAPPLFFSGFLLRSSLGLCLLAAWLLQVARALDRPTLAHWAACGVLAALAGLVRENLLLLGPYSALLVLLLTSGHWRWRRRAGAAALVAAGFLLTCAPVSIYNTWRAGEPVFVRRAPDVLWRHANSAVSWRADLGFPTGVVGDWEHPALPVTSRAFWELQVRKARLLITNDHVPNAAPWGPFAELCSALRFRPVRFGHLLALGCAGALALALWDRRGLWLLPLAGLLASGVVLFGPASRYRVVLVPLLAAAGSAGLLAAWRGVHRGKRLALYSAVLAAFLALQALTQGVRTPKPQDWYAVARLRQRQGDLQGALDACARANRIRPIPMVHFLERQLREQLERRTH